LQQREMGEDGFSAEMVYLHAWIDEELSTVCSKPD
jgi:hypothetical protein